jgi:hypothetical protein
MTNNSRPFTLDGKPFFVLGGQSKNSSGYNDAESEMAFKAVQMLHGNTLEIPVYWEQVEPQEGQFDFASVDALLTSARRYDVKLVVLWFATWKNGNMEYTPAWVKTNPQRFKRVLSPTGKDVWVLSSHCQATFEADRRAFTALCQHLKEKDGAERTVIAVQIENEPGIIGSDRDYGPEGQAAFEKPVPGAWVDKMKTAGQGIVYDLWQQAGGQEAGSWPDLFGWAAGEMLSAWSIATYIDRLAEAGKAVYDIPMYVNVWLGEMHWRIPGDSYPSGGAVVKTLDIYKWFTPHIDLIAPDIYIADSRGYEAICAAYTRPDNPLFVPESAPFGSNAWNMFRAIAEYNATGYACFGIEHMIAPDGTPQPYAQMMVDSFRCVSAAIPLLLQYQGTDQVHAIVQEEGMGHQVLGLEGYYGIVQFGAGDMPYIGKDWRHSFRRLPLAGPSDGERGRGLVFQVSEHEFYLVGAGYQLLLRPKTAPEWALDASLAKDFALTRLAHYVCVDEGHFEDGEFVVDRRRNGDETDHGVWVEPDVGVVHVVMCD